jgi:hypothetical protein
VVFSWPLDGAEALADGAERAAGLDLGQLVRVTDPDELPASGGDVFGQALVGAGADHAGLVDHEHGGRREEFAVVEIGKQAGGVERADPGLLFQGAGGEVAGRGAQDRVSGGGEGGDGDAQRVGLAGAGARLDVLDPMPRAGQLHTSAACSGLSVGCAASACLTVARGTTATSPSRRPPTAPSSACSVANSARVE